MAKDFKAVLMRSPQMVLADLVGVASLVIIFYGAMLLPGLL